MAFYDTRIREEELKHRVAADWFAAYDCARIIGNIDFAVDIPATELALGYAAEPALWAEAKAGVKKDIVESFVQLILTIGRARRADELPPLFLGAFDAEKIAFIPYNAVLDVLGTNDFNWNVTPSDHETKEFRRLHALVSETIAREKMLFDFERDAAELRRFIRVNFRRGRTDVSKLRINKNNFTHIYRKWREAVYPFIDAPWEMLKKNYGIYDRDFYLAEINVDDRDTPDISDDTPAADFYITFRGNGPKPYQMARKDPNGLESVLPFGFKPGGLEAYAEFWRRYKRPPKKEYWSFIVKRLDLLVPQDVRERKGSFFTPKIWVEKSQQYLAQALGENWQDEYFIWDCAGGTGNLEAGLTNKYNVFVSTLDQQDVDVIHQTLGDRGAKTLLDSHVFQFDFLNDSFDDVAKMPAALRDIINDSEKRKKLVVYINPPYAEAGNARQKCGTGENKTSVSNSTRVYERYAASVGSSIRELFVQFHLRIAIELSGCWLGCFSKLKHVQSQNFRDFRERFRATYNGGFIVSGNTFDNVKGSFPIGFLVWQTHGDALMENDALRIGKIDVDIYDGKGDWLGVRSFAPVGMKDFVMNWLRQHYDKGGDGIGFLRIIGPDLQNDNGEFLTNTPSPNDVKKCHTVLVTKKNVAAASVYFTIRHLIEHTWQNDRDQYTIPNCDVMKDSAFVSDCLVFTLFSGQNRINSAATPNHWIPFTEGEVGARDRFASHFMTDFMAGRSARGADPTGDGARTRDGRADCPQPAAIATQREISLNGDCGAHTCSHFASQSSLRSGDTGDRALPAVQPLVFSPAAQAVLAAGRELWRYYHAQPDANPNASYYDIRAHFQGRKPNGTMNATSADEKYNTLLDVLKSAMKVLARQIEPKVYEYGFLRK